jgi:hypothetical protein
VLLAIHSRGGRLSLAELYQAVREQRTGMSDAEIKERVLVDYKTLSL